jgi:hypothetical protein
MDQSKTGGFKYPSTMRHDGKHPRHMWISISKPLVDMKKNIGEQMLPTGSIRFHTQFMVDFVCYPPVNQHNYGKSPFLMGKSTINDHFQ